MRRVTIAFPSTEPRAERTRTMSPLRMPFSRASASGISTKKWGCSWLLAAMFFVQ